MFASNDDIKTMMDMTDTTDAIARSYIEGNSSLEAAINDFFESDGSLKKPAQPVNWAQHSNSQMTAMPPGDIHSLAASRPPSRVGEWLQGSQTTGVVQGPSNIDNDDEYQKAIAASMQDTRRQTVATDVTPYKRKREPSTEPAFMRPLSYGSIDFLPSFLKILHSIPLCRMELLSLGDELDDYGTSETWWSGDFSTGLGTVVSTDHATKRLELLYETQRLMAFLDGTTRLYGSVGVLHRILESSQHRGDTIAAFVEMWEDIAFSDDCQTRRSVPRLLRSVWQNDSGKQGPIRTLSLSPIQGELQDPSLYDALDPLVENNEDAALLHHLAPIMTFLLASNQKRLSIPEVLYLDRYCTSKTEGMRAMENERKEAFVQLEQVKARDAKIRSCKQRKGTAVVDADGLEILQRTIAFLKERNGLITGHKITGDAERLSQADDTLSKLEAAKERIDDQLKKLEESKTQCEAHLMDLRKRFTKPSDDLEQEYVLAGVSIMPNSGTSRTYFMDAGYWWEASFDPSPNALIRKVESVEDVLQWAGAMEHETMLVYIKADADPPIEFAMASEKLQEFITRDNETFAKELAEEAQNIALNTENFDQPDAYNGWTSEDTLADQPFDPAFTNADTSNYDDPNTTLPSLNRFGGRGRGGPPSFSQHEPSQSRMDVDSQGFGAQYVEHNEHDTEMEDMQGEPLTKVRSNSSNGSMTVHGDADR